MERNYDWYKVAGIVEKIMNFETGEDSSANL